MKRFLIIAISGLALTGCLHDFRKDPQGLIYKDKPTGQGNPVAMSCYRPPSSVSRVSRLECKTNSEWARIRAVDNQGSQTDPLGPNSAGHTAILH